MRAKTLVFPVIISDIPGFWLFLPIFQVFQVPICIFQAFPGFSRIFQALATLLKPESSERCEFQPSYPHSRFLRLDNLEVRGCLIEQSEFRRSNGSFGYYQDLEIRTLIYNSAISTEEVVNNNNSFSEIETKTKQNRTTKIGHGKF